MKGDLVYLTHSFEVMGEAIKQLSPELRRRHPNVPWKRIAGFRDVLIHDYMGINLRIVWDARTINLPPLKKAVEDSVRELKEEGA